MPDKKTILTIICSACSALLMLPTNEDFWGYIFSGALCGLCGLVGMKLSTDQFLKASRVGKKIAKGLKKAKKAKKFIEKKFGPGPDLGGE